MGVFVVVMFKIVTKILMINVILLMGFSIKIMPFDFELVFPL